MCYLELTLHDSSLHHIQVWFFLRTLSFRGNRFNNKTCTAMISAITKHLGSFENVICAHYIGSRRLNQDVQNNNNELLPGNVETS